MGRWGNTALDIRGWRRAIAICLSMTCAVSYVGAESPSSNARGNTAKGKGGPQTVLAVSNPLNISRPEEVIAIPLAAIATRTGIGDSLQIRVLDLATEKVLPTQIESSVAGRPADQLLVLVDVPAHGIVRLAFRSGESATLAPLVFGRAVPERKDDFAWENDKVAYRVYGPALEATGEVSSGIDVWSKRTSHLVIDDWYRRDAEGQRTKNAALSYHRDSGEGLDSYEVGTSRGCGGTGVWIDGRLYAARNYTSVEVLESGPLRIRFKLHYAPWRAAGLIIAEEKTVTLDAGSHLNKVKSTFHFDGAKSPQIALGLGLHTGSMPAPLPPDGGILAVWEPLTDPAAGMDGTGLVLPVGKAAKQIDAAGSRLFLVDAESGVPVTYFAGAAWSKSDIPSADAWAAYLRNYKFVLEHPLNLQWESVPDK